MKFSLQGKSKSLGFWIRICFAIGIVAIIVPMLNLKEFTETLSGVNWAIIVLLMAYMIIGRFIMAFKWNILLKAKGNQLAIWEAFKIYLMAGAAGYLMPTGVGSDIYRAFRTSRGNKEKGDIIASILMERVLGMISMVIAGIFGFFMVSKYLPNQFQSFYLIGIISSIVIILVFLISLLNTPFRWMQWLLSHMRQNRLSKMFLDIHEAYLSYRNYPIHMLAFLGITLLMMFFNIMMIKLAAHSLSISIGLVYFFGIIPVINFFQLLPISIAGLGVQEGLYIFFFTQVGATPTQAFSLALLMRSVGLVRVLPGIVLFMFDSPTEKKTENIPLAEKKFAYSDQK